MSLPPPRGERFSDPILDAVWAAICELEPALQFELQKELQARLTLGDVETPVTEKRLKAVACLRRAAAAIEKSPSITEYRRLRIDRPDLQLIPDGTLRSWLGRKTWNECLRDARLECVPDGDVLVVSLGPSFTEAEAVEALREATRELGVVPGVQAYFAWARRPDVRRRPGRRPRSQSPFERLFGGYLPALIAAGLLDGETAIDAPDSTCVRTGKYFIGDDEIRGALREATERNGGVPPRTTRYPFIRRQVTEESRRAGLLRTLPSLGSIVRRYGTWDAALVDAGLAPLGGRSTARSDASTRRPRPSEYGTDEILQAIRHAYEAVGNPFTVAAYLAWRERELLNARLERRFLKLPHYHVIWKRFGTWRNAVELALDRPAREA